MKTRKGLSSVVGTVFAIIALASVVTYVTYSLDILDKFNQGVLVRNEETLDRGKEEFEVLSATIDSNKFNITISNTGTLPINITKMWVQNKSATDWVNGYDIKKSVSPDGVLIKIGQSAPLYANTANAYVIKLVTERGNTKEFSVNSGTTAPLYMQLHAIPSNISDEFTTTLLFEVVNNMSSNDLLLNLTPVMEYTPTTGVTQIVQPLSSYPSLAKGDTAYFKWVYKIAGDVDDAFTFTASLANGYPGNTASATVTLTEVQFAAESATSIQSQGFTCCKTADNILVVHQETSDTPSGAYQIYSAEVEATGTTIDLQSASSKNFFTYNDTDARTVPSGTWTLALRYRSSMWPDVLQDVSTLNTMIFHFNDTSDSSGNGNILTLVNTPSYSAAGVHGNSGIYTFDGINEYMTIPKNTNNDITTTPDSTAAWFKTGPANPSSDMVIYRIEDPVLLDYYEIVIDNAGRVVFRFTTDGVVITDCQSTTDVADGNWHHFAAVRYAGKSCRLYIDGVRHEQEVDGFAGTPSVVATSEATIGRNPGETSYFNGKIDYFMHWNNYALQAILDGGAQDEVLALYNANYGNAAHSADITLDITDKNGLPLVPPKNIHTKIKADLPYNDSKGSLTTYPGPKNYTFTTASDTIFNSQERMKATVSWNPTNAGAVDMYWRIDDTTFSDKKGSYMQIPTPTVGFPSYFVYNTANPLKFTVTNIGPEGIWLTYSGTKVIFKGITNPLKSYGGVLFEGNTSAINEGRDTLYVPLNAKIELEFWKPKKIPDNSQTCTGGVQECIIPGLYRMYINVIGYDDTGLTILKTFPIGPVRVI